MDLKEKHIAPTKSTPEIILSPEGSIKIKGRSMDPYVTDFAIQLEEWVDKYICEPADLTIIDIYLEYLSTNNLKFYVSLFKRIEPIKLKYKEYKINWYYDEGDEDIVEKGEYISAALDVAFNFIMLSDQSVI
jgi:hypothetical protein